MVKRGLSRAAIRAASSLIWAGFALWTGIGSVAAGNSVFPCADVTHRVYTPSVLGADTAKAYLDRLGLATVSQLPMTDGLLITGESSAVNKAFAVLKVVDADSAYEVRLWGSDSVPAALPTCDRIAAALGDVAVGSLEAPPTVRGKAGVIVDRHQGQVLVVAPRDRVERVVALLEGRADPSGVGPDALAGGLDRSTVLRMAEVASWTKSQVLGAAQADPNAAAIADSNATATQGEPDSPPGSATPSVGRITGQTPADVSRIDGPAAPLTVEPNVGPAGTSPRAATQAEAVPQAPPTPALPNGEGKLALDLPEKLPIETLLEYVGNYLRLDFMYDPAKVQGEVTLKLQGKLKGSIEIKDLYPLLESVLKFKGLVMTRRGNIVTVVQTGDVMDADPKLQTDGGGLEFGDAVVTRVFRLRHVEPSAAEALLTQMKLGVAFSGIAETKTLIVTAFTATMPRIEAVLELADQPGEPKQFRYRQLHHTLASTLTDKVKTLAEQMGTIKISISTTAPARPPLTQLPNETAAQFQARRQRELLLQQQAAARAQAQSQPATTPETVYLDADERTNRVLMVGRKDQLAIVDQLVDSLDVAQQDLRSLQLYRIEHVDAEDVRKKLEELGIVAAQPTSPASSTQRITAQQPSTPAAAARPTPQPLQTTEAAVTPLDAPQVVVVEATNSLLVNAAAAQHKRISEVLKYVDSETLDSAMPFEIYPLENQSPDRMAEIIEKLIQETLQDKEGKIEQVVKKIEEEITIVPDPNTFSLVVHASPKNQQWIGKLVTALDKRRPQVLIDVTLVEVSKTDDFTYDLNLVSMLTSATDPLTTSGLTGGLAAGITTEDILEKLYTTGRKYYGEFQSDGGSGTGFYGDKHVNLLLTAMHKKNYGRVLAKPKILVNDNQKGTINTKDITYVKTTSSSLPSEGSQLVETSTGYTPYDAGITMEITPHISEGELLQLNVLLTRSDFTTDATGQVPPNKNQSEINTVVTVPDKSTIILGGLVRLKQDKGTTKVPILGDLPILGGLFRSTSNKETENKKLYVFVKAEIIRPSDVLAGDNALQRISDVHRTAFEEHEAVFQNARSFPGTRPTYMSPIRVLDAQ